MKLPINVVPGAHPSRRFRWQQVVTTPIGSRVVEHVGALPTAVEGAVATLIACAEQLMRENAELRKMVEGMSHRVAAQSELLSERAQRPAGAGDVGLSSPQGEVGGPAVVTPAAPTAPVPVPVPQVAQGKRRR